VFKLSFSRIVCPPRQVASCVAADGSSGDGAVLSPFLETVNLAGAAALASIFGIGNAPDTPDWFPATTAVRQSGFDDGFTPVAVHPGPGMEPDSAEDA